MLAKTALAAVAIAVAAVLSPSADGAATCRLPDGAQVLERTRVAVVYRSDRRVYGCHKPTGRRVRLPSAAPRYTLAGRFVAFRLHAADPDGTQYWLVDVIDLRTDQAAHTSPVLGGVSGYVDEEAPGAVTDIVLKRNGSVAWIGCFASNSAATRCYPPDPELPYQVWRVDSRGRKKLEESEGIRLRSLGRSDGGVTWRNGVERRGATLR